MTTEKQFICECGKTFTNGQSFNGHKSGCKTHHLAKYGTLDKLTSRYKQSSAKSVETQKKQYQQKQKLLIDHFIAIFTKKMVKK